MRKLIAISIAFLATACTQHSYRDQGEIGQRAKAAIPQEMAENLARQPRKVYNHSVIPGGVVDSDEVQARVNQDAVIAEHYNDVKIAKLRAVLLEEKREAYVSYRNQKGIFWTAKPVKLAQAELVLTDGMNEIRGRCGNRISDVPKQPIALREPEHSLDEFAYAPSWAVGGNAHPSLFGVDPVNREFAAAAPVSPELFAGGLPTPAWFSSMPESPMRSENPAPWAGPMFPGMPPTVDGGGAPPLPPPIYPFPPTVFPVDPAEPVPPPVDPRNPVAPPMTPDTPITPTPETEPIAMAVLAIVFLVVGVYKRDAFRNG